MLHSIFFKHQLQLLAVKIFSSITDDSSWASKPAKNMLVNEFDDHLMVISSRWNCFCAS